MDPWRSYQSSSNLLLPNQLDSLSDYDVCAIRMPDVYVGQSMQGGIDIRG